MFYYLYFRQKCAQEGRNCWWEKNGLLFGHEGGERSSSCTVTLWKALVLHIYKKRKKRDFLTDSASGNAELVLLTEVLGGSPFLCNWTRFVPMLAAATAYKKKNRKIILFSFLWWCFMWFISSFNKWLCSWPLPSHLLFLLECFSYLQILRHTLYIDLLLSSKSPPRQCCFISEGPLWLLFCGSPDLEIPIEFLSPLPLKNNSFWKLLAQRIPGF